MESHHLAFVLIIAIVMIGVVLRARYNAIGAREQRHAVDAREEMRRMKERLAVLERIATDKDHPVVGEIERLRDQ